jgi:phosphoribosylglycinamide formyltransferase 1
LPNDFCRLAVLVSGGGTNLGAILQAIDRKEIPGKVVLVVSSRADAFALERANKHGIPTAVVERKLFASESAFQAAVLAAVQGAHPDLICLAGYLKKLSAEFIAAYRGRIINVHPSLLPKFGGAGMYGRNVHSAVLKSGDNESGCTVHLVDEEFDHGPILLQARVPIVPGDTEETLAARILEEEHRLLPLAVRMFCEKLKKEAELR